MSFSSIGKKHLVPTLLTMFIFFMTFPCAPVSAAGPQDSKSPAAVASNAPEFELPDLNGTAVNLSSFKGKKPVLLYFWATWCPYCISVRPAVIDLRKAVPENDLEILAINVGGGDSLARVKRFQEAHPAPLTVLFDAENKVTRSYSIQGIPLFILVDKGGVVRYRGNELPPEPMALLKK